MKIREAVATRIHIPESLVSLQNKRFVWSFTNEGSRCVRVWV